MNQQTLSHTVCNVKSQEHTTPTRLDAEEMLSDIAFVLKMTQRVREEMNTEHDVEELVLA